MQIDSQYLDSYIEKKVQEIVKEILVEHGLIENKPITPQDLLDQLNGIREQPEDSDRLPR